MGGGLAGRGDIGEGRGWDGGEGRGGRMGGRWGEGGGGDNLDGLGNDSSNRSKVRKLNQSLYRRMIVM